MVSELLCTTQKNANDLARGRLGVGRKAKVTCDCLINAVCRPCYLGGPQIIALPGKSNVGDLAVLWTENSLHWPLLSIHRDGQKWHPGLFSVHRDGKLHLPDKKAPICSTWVVDANSLGVMWAIAHGQKHVGMMPWRLILIIFLHQ